MNQRGSCSPAARAVLFLEGDDFAALVGAAGIPGEAAWGCGTAGSGSCRGRQARGASGACPGGPVKFFVSVRTWCLAGKAQRTALIVKGFVSFVSYRFYRSEFFHSPSWVFRIGISALQVHRNNQHDVTLEIKPLFQLMHKI